MTIFEPIYRSTEPNLDVATKLDVNEDYISWFPGQQSTGLWYYKRLIVEGDALVSVPANSIFYIYNPHISGDFVDNKRALKRELYIQAAEGYSNIYLVGCAEEPGEFIDEVTINGQPLKVGMEVYGENELLRLNLQNMGIELPDDIVTSIYETDLYEEKTDWVTLNNKWRELLINYMDIAGCKGNYKSLQNSLEWFNYGRLVELRECWKHETEDGVKLMDRPLNRWLSDWYNKSLADLSKSTFMIIRQCSTDLSKQIGTELPKKGYPDNKNWYVPVYQPYTYDPRRIHENDLSETEIKWAKDEMRMKMTLLGLFFETNFMPVHLDLLRCSVEDIVFDAPYTVRMGGAPELEYTCLTSLNEMTVHGYGKDKEADEGDFDIVLHLDQQSVFGADIRQGTNQSLLNFGIQNKSDLAILGVTYDNPPTEVSNNSISANDIGLISASWFNEIGAIAEFELTTETPVTQGKIITNIVTQADKPITRFSNIICEEKIYNVDWQGNILNYENAHEDAIEWNPNQKYYKQILKDQYAIVNQYGLPVDDVRYDSPQPDWLKYDESRYNEANIYYIQTSKAKYIIVNGLGQQIDDNKYETKPEGEGWLEWSFDLRYKRTLYKTDIKLLCQAPGEFWALIELFNDDYRYARKLNIKVIDNLDVRLEFFKLVWQPDNKNPFEIENLGPNKSMFTTTRDVDTDIWKTQGWKPWGQQGYEIPEKIIDNYKYQQYIPLSIFSGPQSYEALGDKPRLNWVATITSYNGESMDDPEKLLNPNKLQKFYAKKGYEYNEDGAQDSLLYVQYTQIGGSGTEFELKDLLSPIEGLYKISYKREFIPEYHKMVPIDGMEDIPVTYPIIAVPVIELGIGNARRDLTWSHKLDSPAWEFYSYSQVQTVDHLKFNIQQPFIASQHKQYTPNGRYKISFSYKWGNEVKTISRMSPFNIIPD